MSDRSHAGSFPQALPDRDWAAVDPDAAPDLPAAHDRNDRVHPDDCGHRHGAIPGRALPNQVQPGHEQRKRPQEQDAQVSILEFSRWMAIITIDF